MGVPNVFGSATTSIPLSQLDQNFNTGLTIGNTTVGLGNTGTTLGNVTLTNVNIVSGTVPTANSIVNGTSNVVIVSSGGAVNIATNGTQAITVDTSQQVGIGQTPTASTSPLQVKGGSNPAIVARSTSGQALRSYYDDGRTTYTAVNYDGISTQGSQQLNFSSGTSTNFTVNTNATTVQAINIDTSGDLLVGPTATTAHNAAGFTVEGGGVPFVTRGVAGTFMGFYNTTNATLIGYISNVSGTATAYNTTSDYRLKENVAPMANALATVSLLKPCTYKWKSDGSDGQGFIAHELQAVVPDCVTGEKDAVDEEGNPEYQGIDTSFLVATLTAAIQEQQALITTLQEQVTALQAKVGA